MTPNLSRAQGPGRIAMICFGIGAALPVLSVLLSFAGIHLGRFTSPITSLVSFVGVIFFLVFLYRATAAVREVGASRFTPGMAVGWWFIPFANFVMPALTVGDVWKRTVKENGWVVPLWWVTYLLTIVINATRGVPLPSFPGMWILMTAIVVTAYGSWAFILFSINQRAPQQTASAVLAGN